MIRIGTGFDVHALVPEQMDDDAQLPKSSMPSHTVSSVSHAPSTTSTTM